MSQDLKQATTVTVPIGPFVTSTGDALTGLNLSAGDILLSFNGGSFAAKTDAETAGHNSIGWYDCQVGVIDTSALGRIDLAVNKTGALPVWYRGSIITVNQWDTRYAADSFDVNLNADQSAVTIGVVRALTTVGVVESLTTVGTVGVVQSLTTVGTVGVVQALTTVGTVQSLSSIAVVHSLTTVGTVGTVQALTTVGTVQSLSSVAIVHSLTTVGTVESLSSVAVVHSLTTVGTVQSLSSIISVTDIGSVLDVTKSIWDRVLSGATHNVAASAGRRLRQVEDATIIETGTVASATASTIEFPGALNGNDNYYDHQLVIIIGGTGAGQSRTFDGYNGTDKTATVHPNWVTIPNSASTFELYGSGEVHVHQLEDEALTAITNELDQNSTHLAAIILDTADIQPNYAAASTVAGVAQATAIAAIGPAKNVALSNFSFFMKKASDHITPLTAVSPVGFTRRGSTTTYASLTNAVAEVGSYGQYMVDFSQTEMNDDIISFVFTAAGADQVDIIIIPT